MIDIANAAFAQPWRQLWNGDLAQLEDVIAENVVAHAALMGGTAELHLADGLLTEFWVNSDTLLLTQQLGIQAGSSSVH